MHSIYSLSKFCLVVSLILVGLSLTPDATNAWEPEGWVYMQWPYAYSAEDTTWYYFDETQPLYCQNQCSGEVILFGHQGLRYGWLNVDWPQGYWFSNGCFYAFSETDRLACLNLTTFQTSRFQKTRQVLSRRLESRLPVAIMSRGSMGNTRKGFLQA